jgi:hypothetical protein
MVVMSSVVPLALEAGAELAGLLPPAAGVFAAADELLLELELAHADKASARAASPATPIIFRI